MEPGKKAENRIGYQSIPQTDSLGRNIFYVIALTIVAGFVEVTGYMDLSLIHIFSEKSRHLQNVLG